MADLPTARQIEQARVPLETAAATGIAVFHMTGWAPEDRINLYRRLYVEHLHCAARALGLELVNRSAGLHLAVDNSEPSTMREVQ
jgi:hypothetical protein